MLRRHSLSLIASLLAIALLSAFFLRTFTPKMADDFAFWVYQIWLLLVVLITSIPQPVLWGLLLAVGLLLLYGSLHPADRRRAPPVRKEAPRSGRVSHLAQWIKRSEQGAYFHWNLARALANLAAEIEGLRAGKDPAQIMQRLREGTWQGPQRVREYLRFGAGRLGLPRERGLWARLKRGLRQTSIAPSPEQMAQTVAWLESQLEVVDEPDH
jgi:hypothetical protein